MGLMGLLRESYSHQCPSIRPTMNNPWFLVACPVLMGALGILYTETENGSDRNPKTRQPFGGDDGFHPNHSLRLWLDAQGLKKMFFFKYICLLLLTNMLGNTERKPRYEQKYMSNMKAKHWKSVTLHIVVILSSFLFLWNWILLHELLSNITHNFITCPKQITAPFWGVKSFNLWHIRIVWSAMCDLITLDSLREESINFTERK